MTTGRREQNKARTRADLLEALRAQVAATGLAGVTAEAVAERAGVSRRTFFNYFSSLDDALAGVISPSLDEIGAVFRSRPAAEQPLDAIVAALRQRPLDPDALAWIHTIGSAERARQG